MSKMSEMLGFEPIRIVVENKTMYLTTPLSVYAMIVEQVKRGALEAKIIATDKTGESWFKIDVKFLIEHPEVFLEGEVN